MLLQDLFEQDPLKPGEERTREVIKRDIDKIQDRIAGLLYDLIGQKDLLKRDPYDYKISALVDRLKAQKARLEKLLVRPTASQLSLLETIESECSEVIEIFRESNHLLYRGTQSSVSAYEGRSWDARKPTHSSPEATEKFDELLRELGFRAGRGNSVFVTSSWSFAREYSTGVYIIIPKNGFDWLQTNRKDLILDDITSMIPYETLTNLQNHVRAWVKANDPQDRYDLLVMRLPGVWMEKLRKNWRDGNPLNMPEEFNKDYEDLITPEGFEKDFEPQSHNLVEAIRKPNEIMIHGEYWALRSSDWQAILDSRWALTRD